MNKLIAFVLALALALTLVGCNIEKSNKKKRLNRGCYNEKNNAISQTEKGGVWEKEKWVLYPISNNKNRIKMRPDTVLENFTLYCPKCKQETTINVTGQNVVVKSQEATNED